MLLGVWAMKSKFKKTNLLLQGLHCKLVKKKSMAMKTKAPLMTPIQKMTNPMTSGLPWIQALSSLWTTKGLCLKWVRPPRRLQGRWGHGREEDPRQGRRNGDVHHLVVNAHGILFG